MEILKDINQIYNLLGNMFNLNINSNAESDELYSETKFRENEFNEDSLINIDLLKQNNFAFQFADEKIIKNLANHIENIKIQKSDVEKLSKLMFQLNNFTPLLCNLTVLFLSAKKYDCVFIITSKIFVSHIGNQVYHSKNANNFTERYFDRFIEIVKSGNIQPEIYIPFLFKIYKSNKSEVFSVWKNPALEYLQKFWNKNINWFLEFIEKNPEDRYNVFSAILNFDSVKGVEYLINDYIQEKKLTPEETSNLIKIFKRDILFYIEKETPQADVEKQIKFVEIMLNMDSDAEVMSRIKNIYENSKDSEIKSLISNYIGKSELLNKRTEKQFLNAVRREIKEPQERVLNIPFSRLNLKFVSEYPADNAVYTYFINLFKEEKNLNNLSKLSVISKIFSPVGLDDMTLKLFEELKTKPDIKQAKWCCRLVVLLSNEELEKEISKFIFTLFERQRNKEALYLIHCLIYSNKAYVIFILKKLIEMKICFIIENINELIQLIADKCNINIEDIKDILVTNEYTSEQFENEKSRLFNAFLNEKMYSPELFQTLFFENSLFNKLAQNLVFGEYKQGKLQNAFVLENQKIKFLVGESLFGLEKFISENLNKNLKSENKGESFDQTNFGNNLNENLDEENDNYLHNNLTKENDNYLHNNLTKENAVETIQDTNENSENENIGEVLLNQKINDETIEENKEHSDYENSEILTDENIDTSENIQEQPDLKKFNKSKMKDVAIGIIHPQDCDLKFYDIFDYFKNPTFKQFEKTKFSVKDYNNCCVAVSNFAGLLVSPKRFCDFLTKKNFLLNKFNEEKEFNSLVHIMPSLNIICELEFNQLVTENSSALANLGNICFYKLSDTLKANNKYITKKANSLNINSLPYRYFNYILSLIQEAIFNK